MLTMSEYSIPLMYNNSQTLFMKAEGEGHAWPLLFSEWP